MEAGAAEREALLRQQLKVMPPERFEQLVLALAQREYSQVRRLRHPDGGADVLRPATSDRQAEVWQAKRYGDDINWHECEKSLSAAIKRWAPSKVTFVFARDLSQQLESSFESRLVQHDDAREAGVEVLLWNESVVVSRLDENADLKPRFFGQEQESLLSGVERAIKTRGRLESGADLVERAKTERIRRAAGRRLHLRRPLLGCRGAGPRVAGAALSEDGGGRGAWASGGGSVAARGGGGRAAQLPLHR